MGPPGSSAERTIGTCNTQVEMCVSLSVAKPPAVDELSMPDVSKVLRRQDGKDFRRTLLALKRVVRRNYLFRETWGSSLPPKNRKVQVALPSTASCRTYMSALSWSTAGLAKWDLSAL